MGRGELWHVSFSRLLGSGLKSVLHEEINGPPNFFSTPLQVAVARLPHLRHQLQDVRIARIAPRIPLGGVPLVALVPIPVILA